MFARAASFLKPLISFDAAGCRRKMGIQPLGGINTYVCC
jgi:hypothetical protein